MKKCILLIKYSFTKPFVRVFFFSFGNSLTLYMKIDANFSKSRLSLRDIRKYKNTVKTISSNRYKCQETKNLRRMLGDIILVTAFFIRLMRPIKANRSTDKKQCECKESRLLY